MKQLKLELEKGRRGGRREGAGRKRIHSRGVAHRIREKVSYRAPLHINFKYKTHIRNKLCLKLLKKAILNARTHGLRIIHFSMQSNHIHIIIEAESNSTLSTGMRSLTVTFAKGLKQGRVQLERYHLQVLRSVQQVRNAVNYVLFNKQKHEKGICSTVDEYCSVWALGNVYEVIGNYARKAQVTLRIGDKSIWQSDHAISFLLKSALKSPTSWK